MKIFITADHHFHHKNIIEYCGRPFKTVEEMDKIMTEKWNKKVGRKDPYPCGSGKKYKKCCLDKGEKNE